MKTLLIATVSVTVLACTQIVSLPASAQSTSQLASVGDSGGGSASAASRQLSLLCHAHRQRLGEWEQGGRPGRISSPTSAVAIFPDDSPARYAAEIEQLCVGAPEPDSAMLAQLKADREAIRTRFDNVQPQTSAEGSTPVWSNLPRRQALGGADVFDNAVNHQSSGQEAKEQMAQRIPELSAQAIAQQSVDLTSAFLGNLAQALNIQEALTRQQSIRLAPQNLSPAGSSIPAAIAPPVATSTTTNNAGRRELPVNYTDHPNSTNGCVELRGNTIGNKCNFDLLVSFCVSQPQQTKNFFDSSGAFECGKGGGLSTIKAGRTEGNVLYGYINFYACPYTDYYTPARMKTQFSATGLGLYRGTCGDGDKLSNNWTIGGVLVSRPK